MKIAIPTIDDSIAEHFGRCEKYSFYEISESKVMRSYQKESPTHAPNVIPRFLATEGTDLVITSGIGKKAISLFDDLGIKVITGCYGQIDNIIKDYLSNELVVGDSTCKHEEEVK